MVGNATFKIELSSISKRKTADSPARATQASRNDWGACGDRIPGCSWVVFVRMDAHVCSFRVE